MLGFSNIGRLKGETFVMRRGPQSEVSRSHCGMASVSDAGSQSLAVGFGNEAVACRLRSSVV